MRRKLFLLLALICLCLALCACGADPSGGDEAAPADEADATVYKLTFSSTYASTHPQSVIAEQWIKAVEERSEGRIDIEYYPGGSLASDSEAYESLMNGIFDICVTDLASSNSGQFQSLSYFNMPWGYPDAYVASHASYDFLTKYADLPEMSDIQVLLSFTTAPMVFITKEKVETPADVKGMIVRAASDYTTMVGQALGGQSYACSITELYEAFSKGIVDATVTGADVLSSFNLGDVTKFVLREPSLGKVSTMVTLMSKSKFAELPEDLQQILLETGEEFVENHACGWLYSSNIEFDNFLALGDGREVIVPTAEQSAAFEDVLLPAYENYIATSLSSLDDAAKDEYLGFIQERIDYWSAQEPGADEVSSWYEENVTPFLVQ